MPYSSGGRGARATRVAVPIHNHDVATYTYMYRKCIHVRVLGTCTVSVYVRVSTCNIATAHTRVGRGARYSSAFNAPQKTVMLPSYVGIVGILLLMGPKDTCTGGGSGIGALETVEHARAFWRFSRSLELAVN